MQLAASSNFEDAFTLWPGTSTEKSHTYMPKEYTISIAALHALARFGSHPNVHRY
jgi:hypothetical protein